MSRVIPYTKSCGIFAKPAKSNNKTGGSVDSLNALYTDVQSSEQSTESIDGSLEGEILKCIEHNESQSSEISREFNPTLTFVDLTSDVNMNTEQSPSKSKDAQHLVTVGRCIKDTGGSIDSVNALCTDVQPSEVITPIVVAKSAEAGSSKAEEGHDHGSQRLKKRRHSKSGDNIENSNKATGNL
ncbi:uncharacterized protein LOC129566597 [Sitodiplosis mosellana]|uniref:uncharacterized protein LOC129566597 n=1 Tax=Sitodiplosis mosellana TaxID=263140 RepID=UPI00244499A9|nr:uncharacterized protein LOC129566597 [Sitodiplosis mosellana]